MKKKKNGVFEAVGWKRALTCIAQNLKKILSESGSQSVGVISSARATNEDNYAAQKFARAVFKNQIT